MDSGGVAMAQGGNTADINPAAMDVFEFIRQQRRAQGEVGLGRFVRLLQDLPGQADGEAGQVHWTAQGERGARGEQLLRLRIVAQPMVECQRCLQPFAWPVDTEVLLQPVLSQAELDDELPADEEEAIENQPEKVLGSRRFDLLAQIEDELILSIPYVPRHEVCPDEVAGTAASQAEPETGKRPSPFQALAQLKRRDDSAKED